MIPCDNNGHGTHTMGTMVGDDGGANQIGVAPNAKFIACKGCWSSTCFSFDLTACAQWIVDPGPGAAPPHIVNNSWGGGGGSSWYQSYVQNWVAAGIYPAFSNGNTGPNCSTSGSPGDYPESISAGAADSSDLIASFSSRGPSAFGGIKPDLAAPGVNVRPASRQIATPLSAAPRWPARMWPARWPWSGRGPAWTETLPGPSRS